MDKVIVRSQVREVKDQLHGKGNSHSITVFSKTGLKHRQDINRNRTNVPQAPACSLHEFVCPFCGHLLSAGAKQWELIRARSA